MDQNSSPFKVHNPHCCTKLSISAYNNETRLAMKYNLYLGGFRFEHHLDNQLSQLRLLLIFQVNAGWGLDTGTSTQRPRFNHGCHYGG